jgi:heme o synthase
VKDAHAHAGTVSLSDARPFGRVADYFELAKPRLNVLVVITGAAGYYLGAQGAPEPAAMAQAVAGTALLAGGAAVLNQLLEQETDALMRRTRMRPLPDGRVSPGGARVYGFALSGCGLALLAGRANLLSAMIALVTLLTYLGIYTPMKRRSPMATLVGAIPGALPALIGWTAARGSLSAGGWVLAAIVFCWQVPHFMAIAWLFRDDYRQAGFPMLPVVDPTGIRAGRYAVGFTVALIAATLGPAWAGMTGPIYPLVALVLGTALLWTAVQFLIARSDNSAWILFFGSIVYLPLVWTAMIADRI